MLHGHFLEPGILIDCLVNLALLVSGPVQSHDRMTLQRCLLVLYGVPPAAISMGRTYQDFMPIRKRSAD